MTTLHAVVCVCVCADVMQMIGCHDSAAVVAADNIDVSVTVVSVADDGEVTVDIDAYAALYCLFYCDAVWLGSRVVSALDSGAVGPGFKSAAMPSGNSLRQTVHTHCTSVHQAAKLVAALLRVAG